MTQLQNGILMGIQPKKTPQRIISLVPSQTELLYDLGLDDQVIGITKFCVHPESWFTNKLRIGGTKTIDVDKIIELMPDLVIANKEENQKEQIEILEKYGITIYVSNVADIDDAYGMMHDIGMLTGTLTKANQICNDIKTGFMALPANSSLSFAYFMWHNPYMVAGGDTFISNLLSTLGWHNVMESSNRYPAIEMDARQIEHADLLLFSSEPFPFAETHLLQLPEACRKKAMLVDGEMLSWYGSRLLKAPKYLRALAKKAGSLLQ